MAVRHYVPKLTKKPLVALNRRTTLEKFIQQMCYLRRGYLCVSQAIRMVQYYYPAEHSFRIASTYNSVAHPYIDFNNHVEDSTSYIHRSRPSHEQCNPLAGTLAIPDFPLYEW